MLYLSIIPLGSSTWRRSGPCVRAYTLAVDAAYRNRLTKGMVSLCPARDRALKLYKYSVFDSLSVT